MDAETGVAARGQRRPLSRPVWLFFLLFALQTPLLAFVFDPLAINATDGAWLLARAVLREAVMGVLVAAVALGVLLFERRAALLAEWRGSFTSRRWRAFLGANLLLFSALVPATLGLNRLTGSPPWLAFFAWCGAVAAMTLALGVAAAPPRYWLKVARREWAAIAVAVGAAALTVAAAVLSRQSWDQLSAATFQVAAFVLSLLDADPIVDPAARILGAGGFKVEVAAACSGYEGIGLVAGFVSLYLFAFRRVLRFPNAWLLFPIGIAAVWLLNAVRIAALVLIGARVSPEIAVSGFHSQAGWIMFLIVTIGLMAASYQSPFFTNVARTRSAPAGDFAAAMLAPFLSVTAAGILIAALSEPGGAFRLYAIKVAVGAIALALVWKRLDPRRWLSFEGAVIGAMVGVVWFATEPARADVSPLADWLASAPPAAIAVFFLVRAAGFVVIVPIAEELAFRGYLHRALAGRRFEETPEARFTWLAFLVTSLLFGLVHDRWIAGALAGAAFALALYKTGRIGGAISAHAAANLAILTLVAATQRWDAL